MARIPGEQKAPTKSQAPWESSVPAELLNFIRDGKKFLIAGHKEPDGDCVGSQLALASVLRRIGKDCILCSAGPFKRSEIYQYESLFCSSPNGVWGPDYRVILTDCSGLERTGKLSKYLEGRPMAVIDHHETGEFSAGVPYLQASYIDETIASTTILIMKLIAALALEVSREEAKLLFLGLCTDTGFFRHVDEGDAETFEAAAALVRTGANPRAAYSTIYGGKNLDSRRFIGHILVKVEPLFGGKLLLSSEDYDDICRFGRKGRDSESLYQLLQTVEDVEAIAIIRQETPDNCTIGFRSRSWVDVGSIANAFGGGGHKNASGVSLPGTIAELRERVIKAFEEVFD